MQTSSSQSSWPCGQVEFPVIALTVRLKETMAASQLSEDLLADWLRMMPVNAEQVKVEAGFTSFSTLLIVSLPVEIWCYLDSHPAMTLMGFARSRNLVVLQKMRVYPHKKPSENGIASAWHMIR